MKKWLNMLIIFSTSLVFLTGHTFAEPKEKLIEEALLQQLHHVIQSSLKSIYQEQYPQYHSERIVSINERVTTSKKKREAKPVDAIHGQKYFEIVVGLRRINGEYVELSLKNDVASAQYYLAGYKKGVPPKGPK